LVVGVCFKLTQNENLLYYYSSQTAPNLSTMEYVYSCDCPTHLSKSSSELFTNFLPDGSKVSRLDPSKFPDLVDLIMNHYHKVYSKVMSYHDYVYVSHGIQEIFGSIICMTDGLFSHDTLGSVCMMAIQVAAKTLIGNDFEFHHSCWSVSRFAFPCSQKLVHQLELDYYFIMDWNVCSQTRARFDKSQAEYTPNDYLCLGVYSHVFTREIEQSRVETLKRYYGDREIPTVTRRHIPKPKRSEVSYSNFTRPIKLTLIQQRYNRLTMLSGDVDTKLPPQLRRYIRKGHGFAPRTVDQMMRDFFYLIFDPNDTCEQICDFMWHSRIPQDNEQFRVLFAMYLTTEELPTLEREFKRVSSKETLAAYFIRKFDHPTVHSLVIDAIRHDVPSQCPEFTYCHSLSRGVNGYHIRYPYSEYAFHDKPHYPEIPKEIAFNVTPIHSPSKVPECGEMDERKDLEDSLEDLAAGPFETYTLDESEDSDTEPDTPLSTASTVVVEPEEIPVQEFQKVPLHQPEFPVISLQRKIEPDMTEEERQESIARMKAKFLERMNNRPSTKKDTSPV